MVDFSIRNPGRMELTWIEKVLKEAPLTRLLEIHGCDELTEISGDWPSGIVDLRLNNNTNLEGLPDHWPENLRRLELEGSKVSELPEFGPSLDYINLRGTKELSHLPAIQGQPQTLYIHRSGLHLRDELFGDQDFNSARYVLAHLERERVPDHDVKVILLGNGTMRKSSLARCFG